MGLLDALNSEQGLLGLSLLAAAAPKERRTTIGEGLLMASQNVQNMRNAQEERALKKRMMDMQLAGMEAQAQERKRLQEMEQRRGQYLGALDANQGPPMQPTAAGALAAGLSPQEYGMVAPKSADPMAIIDKISPKDYTPESIQQFMLTRNPAVLRAAPKDEKMPEAIRAIEAVYGAGSPQAIKAKQDYIAKMTTHQPAAQVSVPINLGQKGFDNTLKLRGDFRGEPVYKAHQEMQSAYSQIQQSLKQASPAGDLAGATKIMKLLDPGSVVRESELGMAMAASGLMDRVVNYADNIIKGTKLTPTQRADFQRLADALFSESVKQYNAKRAEYQGIAERNGLNVQDVLGDPSQGPSPANGGWSIRPKGQ